MNIQPSPAALQQLIQPVTELRNPAVVSMHTHVHAQGLTPPLLRCMVCCSHISPRAVANIDDTAAAITLRDTSFASNNHSGVTCYEASGWGIGFSWDNFQCYVPSNEAGAAGLTTVSNVTFSGVTRFVGNTWGALHSR
jgi:hypothetical protein